MIKPPKPHNERARLEMLRSLRILDTPPEERFDRVTRLARRVFNVPIAMVSLVDAERQWFKSRQGLEACDNRRDISFCGHAILEDRVFVISDALKDGRFFDNPLVTSQPAIRFYAGYPLNGPDGMKLGTLCIIDREPRRMSKDDIRLLMDLGRMIEEELIARTRTTVDAVTGLSNLKGFELMTMQALAVCRRLQRPAALLYLDIDGFAALEQTAGREAADAALVEVAHMLLPVFRESDVVARIGPDEFGVLLTGADDCGVRASLERLLVMLRDRNRRNDAGQQLTLQHAVVAYSADRHESIADLISDAASRLQAASVPARQSA